MWAGGKTRMIKKYGDILPESFDSYVEPFLGAGAMFVWAYNKNPDATFVLNDYNESIMGIYEAIKNDVAPFTQRMDELSAKYLPLEKSDRKAFYYALREEHAFEFDKWTSTEEAASLYFLMKTGFNGIWQINKNTNGRYGTPSGLLNQKDSVYDKENLKEWSSVLNSTDSVITSVDWKEVPMGDFTFYDPPYRDSFANYNTKFPDSETEELIRRVENNKNVWLCNRDSGDLFFENRRATLNKFPVTYTAGRRKKTENGFAAKKATEILLYN